LLLTFAIRFQVVVVKQERPRIIEGRDTHSTWEQQIQVGNAVSANGGTFQFWMLNQSEHFAQVQAKEGAVARLLTDDELIPVRLSQSRGELGTPMWMFRPHDSAP